MRRDEQANRDCEIVVARLSGETTRQVAASFGVSPRTVRRVMEQYREGRMSLADDALDPLARVYSMLSAKLRELQDAYERSEAAEQRRALNEAQLGLAVELLNIGRAIGKPVERHERAVDMDELQEFNGRVRAVLTEHSVPPEVIDAATDANIDPFLERRGLDLGARSLRSSG
jgi:hypothetical protein